MNSHVVKHVDEMESIFHGALKRAGAELGVASFGMQVFDLSATSDAHPAHDHTHDGPFHAEDPTAKRGPGLPKRAARVRPSRPAPPAPLRELRASRRYWTHQPKGPPMALHVPPVAAEATA